MITRDILVDFKRLLKTKAISEDLAIDIAFSLGRESGMQEKEALEKAKEDKFYDEDPLWDQMFRELDKEKK